MGNRAVIATTNKDLGIYLHWNGGRDSVEAFLAYCERQGYRSPGSDNYGWARLCQVIANFFGGGLCIGIDKYEKLDRDNGDNGVYFIEGWKIVGRKFAPDYEQQEYDLEEMVEAIGKAQPVREEE
jgi:hypothetical protein